MTPALETRPQASTGEGVEARHSRLIVDPLVLTQVRTVPVEPPLDGNTYGIVPRVMELARVEFPETERATRVERELLRGDRRPPCLLRK